MPNVIIPTLLILVITLLGVGEINYALFIAPEFLRLTIIKRSIALLENAIIKIPPPNIPATRRKTSKLTINELIVRENALHHFILKSFLIDKNNQLALVFESNYRSAQHFLTLMMHQHLARQCQKIHFARKEQESIIQAQFICQLKY